MAILDALSEDEKAQMLAQARHDAARLSQDAHWRSRQQGMQEGRQRGLQEGQAQLLLSLLRKRFSSIPEEIAHKLLRADQRELEEWSARILVAQELADVFQAGD